jgi:hypothetical protein
MAASGMSRFNGAANARAGNMRMRNDGDRGRDRDHRRFRDGFFAFGFAPFGYDDYGYDDTYAYACPTVRVRYVQNGRAYYRDVERCY